MEPNDQSGLGDPFQRFSQQMRQVMEQLQAPVRLLAEQVAQLNAPMQELAEHGQAQMRQLAEGIERLQAPIREATLQIDSPLRQMAEQVAQLNAPFQQLAEQRRQVIVALRSPMEQLFESNQRAMAAMRDAFAHIAVARDQISARTTSARAQSCPYAARHGSRSRRSPVQNGRRAGPRRTSRGVRSKSASDEGRPDNSTLGSGDYSQWLNRLAWSEIEGQVRNAVFWIAVAGPIPDWLKLAGLLWLSYTTLQRYRSTRTDG